ncbi:NAD-dependent succinate-semialdehyde dehydrogenase [Glutamicibacter sp. Je.9.36]|uniref:NAD-dependent succinate-semialdehyde dehydrogenase n=1 Tax=Glutamicibacter sp. Je.9.36 TaxID=3142837 RepID=UPI003DA8877B
MNSVPTASSETSTRLYQTINPATDEVLDSFPQLTDSQIQETLERAHAAFLEWRHVAVSRKVELFLRMADLIEGSRDDLARLATLEMGKTLAQSQGEVSIVASMFRYYADHAPQMLADQEVAVPGFSNAYTRREPIGVVLGIEPWNVPMYQAMRAAVPNLMLGNTVLLKPSEISAGSTLYFDKLFREAGFPADVYQTSLISREQVSQLISDIRVRAVTLTGSDRAGAEVGAQAGRNVKPVVLELGGSDAFIVLDSADVDKAVATAAAWRLAIGGQVCVSPKRIIVTEAVADEFIEKFTQIFSNQIVGDPFDPSVTVGPLSTKGAADSLQAQYQDAIERGATVLVPGGRMNGPGAFFRPAVLTGITEDMRVFSEEAFGPLGMIYRVPDADSAVRLANVSKYGLGGTVFGEDLEEAGRTASMLDTGAVGINGFIGAPIEIPFGGTKSSGIGRELGNTGMDPFANVKTYGIA